MKSLLFTGASGFLGNNVSTLLKKEYSVSTIGLTEQDDYNINLARNIPVLKEHYDIVLHAAGKLTQYQKLKQRKRYSSMLM
jgi:nucleoside-diphosphate-sugar epimerase